MASQRDNQEQTKNSKWSASNYDDATYLYGESEKESDYEDNDFSTINTAQLTSFGDYSSDRRSLERDAGNLDLIVIYSIMERIRMLEKRIEVMESRLSTAEELRNSEAETIKHTKMETKVRRSE
uniref:uncharacterized protein LOC120338056 isoform X2 n=1 Tax=Styela clava TaxID=7725 RepID=UPI00193A8464|nr:uncharacterized protein LOC120338056 isoform X2 [Styela clava]